jgi:aryl-alcohol dehydrogenase-like predicted oxidoreductase
MVDAKQLRRLGKTDIIVSPIGLGVMEMSGGGGGLIGKVFPSISQEDKNAIIKAALDGGINFFDTAEMYGAGVSETSLANGLKAAGAADKDVVIETKWLPIFRTAANIGKTISDRLRYLDGYTISNYMIHQPWSFSTPEAEMDAMADLVEAGKIKSVGVSNFNPERMRRAHDALAKRGLPLVVNQMRYSLIHREIEMDGTLAAAKELGITIVAYTPLGSGILSGKYHKNPELLDHKNFYQKGLIKNELERTRPLIHVMDEIALAHNATLAQVALNWVINFNGDCVVTIPGATKVRQAQESAAAMNFILSADELTRLDEASRKLMK